MGPILVLVAYLGAARKIARVPAADGSIEFYAPAAVRHTVVLLSAEQVATHLRTGQLRKVS